MEGVINITILKQPRNEPIALKDAKTFLRIDHDSEDELINNLIKTARQVIENYTGRAIVTQVRRANYKVSNDKNLYVLPGSPFKKIKNISLLLGEKKTPVDGYIVDLSKPLIGVSLTRNYFHDSLLSIEWVCGYGKKPIDVPHALCQAILMLVAELYENRLTENRCRNDSLPTRIRNLCDPYRIMTLI